MISEALHSKTFRPVRLGIALALVALAAGAFNLAHQASGAQRVAVTIASASQTAPASTGVLDGTAGNDALTASNTASTVQAGAGADTIFSANGWRDVVNCGSGLDHVTADRVDVLRNCEYVVRVES